MKSYSGFRFGQTILLAAIFLSTTSTIPAAAPVVSNVRASQRAGTKLVDIYYDLSDADSTNISVSIFISANAGATWTVPACTFTGTNAYGGGVTPGVDKHVVWNAGADWDGQYTSQCRTRVIANDADPAGMALIPAGSFQMGDNLDGLSGAPVHSVSNSAFYTKRG